MTGSGDGDATFGGVQNEPVTVNPPRDCWYVVDHERDDVILRGPYFHATTAGAVRTEMERQERYADKNLWIVSDAYWREGE